MTDPRDPRLILTPGADHDHDHADDDFTHLGLAADTQMLGRSVLDRRRLLGLGALGVGTLLGAVALAGPTALAGRPPLPPGGPGGPAGPAGQGDADTVSSADGQCRTLPSETQGPYPADGSSASGQTLNLLEQSGIVRRDLTRSLKTGHAVVGVPLTLKLQLVNVKSNCAPLAGHVFYLWSCTPAGEYSLYSRSIVGEDYLRGAQVTDAQGRVTFQTVFPGCYAGRWPHLHFEVYPNLAAAVKGNVDHNAALVSQIALPETVCRAVYADPRYSGSLRNFGAITLATDNVFRDGVAAQTPRITGSAAAGYTANLTVGLQP